MTFTCNYSFEAEPSRSPAPPVAEVCRQVTPSGVVIVRYADGSLKALLREEIEGVHSFQLLSRVPGLYGAFCYLLGK